MRKNNKPTIYVRTLLSAFAGILIMSITQITNSQNKVVATSMLQESNPAATITALWQTREAITATLAILAPQKLATLNADRATTTPTPTSTPLPPIDIGANPNVTTLTGLNVRTSPSTAASTITVLPSGAQLDIFDGTENCRWLQIRLSASRFGWIANNPKFTFMNRSCEYVTALVSANKKFLESNYVLANQLYKDAAAIDETTTAFNQPTDLLFRRVIASAISEDPEFQNLLTTLQLRDPTFHIFTDNNLSHLVGSDFRLMEPLNPPTTTFGIALGSSLEPGAGALFWNGRGSILIQVKQTTKYRISFELRHSIPPPIKIELGVDGQRNSTVSLTKGDNSWERSLFEVELETGYHTIDIWFLNDYRETNVDRNAYFKAIEIQPVETPMSVSGG